MAGVVASKVRKQRAKERPSLKEVDKEEKRPIKVLKCTMKIFCCFRIDSYDNETILY